MCPLRLPPGEMAGRPARAVQRSLSPRRPRPPPSQPPPATGGAVPATRGRRITVRVLIWGTTLLAIIGIFAIWADRQMFSADNWANTSTKLLQNEQIRDATSNYLVEQLYANVNVEEEIKKRLPKEVQALAGPISGWHSHRRDRSRQTHARDGQGPGSLEDRQPGGRPDARQHRRRREGDGRDQRRGRDAGSRRRSSRTSPTGSGCRK